MTVVLTPDQQRLHDEAAEFARARLGADLVDRDRDETFDQEGWRHCAEFGVLGMAAPEQYGGTGLGLAELIAVMEGLGYGTTDLGLLFSIHAHVWTNVMPILQHGTDEQRQRYLPPLCSGEYIGANGASEPGAGSDLYGSLTTSAVAENGSYVLNGTKTFVTNAPVADLFVTYATIDPKLGPMGVTAFILERDDPGLSVSRPMDKMGLRTSPMGELILDDCRVPADRLLGREGRGIGVFESSMEWERGCILASCLGAMRRQLEKTIEHARQREQFGDRIGKFQSVANRIVDMKVRLDTCRPLVHRIGRIKDAGQPARMEAAIAKLHVSECFVESSLDAMRTFGGYGYMTEQQVERELRDALGGLFYSGTSDIQRNIIARCLGL